jgi:hypothetical protein
MNTGVGRMGCLSKQLDDREEASQRRSWSRRVGEHQPLDDADMDTKYPLISVVAERCLLPNVYRQMQASLNKPSDVLERG